MQAIDRGQLKEKLDTAELQAVIEVLGPRSYAEYHIPGAVNVPFGDENFDAEIQEAAPDKSKPVAVYCMDASCDASPKAAARMEELGYEQVFDYEAGKADWKGAGYPVEP